MSAVESTIRCPACRGTKKVPKLGGMIGKCDTCLGKGLVPEFVRVKLMPVEPEPAVEDVIAQVADAVATTVVDMSKVDGKKATFKHKRA